MPDASASHTRKRNWNGLRKSWLRGGPGLVVLLAFIGVLFDHLLGLMPVFEAIKIGGYVNSQSIRSGSQGHVVLLDLSQVVPPRVLNRNPKRAKDPEWVGVAHNWSLLREVVLKLQEANVRAIAIDWELALPDQYYSIGGGFFNYEMISRRAATAYRDLIGALVRIDNDGIPVAICADALSVSRLNFYGRWFPVQGAEKLAATALGPPPSVGDYVSTAFASKSGASALLPLNELVASRVGDKLKDSAPLWGFSPYAYEIERSVKRSTPYRQFWVDFGLVSPQPLRVSSVHDLSKRETQSKLSGKIVVIGDIEKRESHDLAVVPHVGGAPGAFHHASAIATRVVSPLFAPVSNWVDAAYSFAINLILGFLALLSAALIGKLGKWPHGSRSMRRTEAWCEFAISAIALFAVWWLTSNIAVHRWLLPFLVMVLIIRFTELYVVGRNAIAHRHSPH